MAVRLPGDSYSEDFSTVDQDEHFPLTTSIYWNQPARTIPIPITTFALSQQRQADNRCRSFQINPILF